ncbi:MAG: hypothetical protein FWF53_03355 [Candidatus Azobacteroides sp.]|nr:hypothetical protein [Candidatus Azobacteroides sp.]
MKQLILNALKAKFEGVSENILNRIAEKLAKTVTKEDDVQAATDAVTFQQIIDSEADRRATEATQTAVNNYEKKYSIKEGKPVTTGGGQGTQTEPDNDNKGNGNTDDIPEWAKALIDSNKALGEKISGIEKDKVSVSRKQKLEAVIEKLPETLRKPYSRIALTDMSDEDFETFINETGADVDGLVTDLAAKGSVLQPPKSGGGATKVKEPTKEETDAVINGML